MKHIVLLILIVHALSKQQGTYFFSDPTCSLNSLWRVSTEVNSLCVNSNHTEGYKSIYQNCSASGPDLVFRYYHYTQPGCQGDIKINTVTVFNGTFQCLDLGLGSYVRSFCEKKLFVVRGIVQGHFGGNNCQPETIYSGNVIKPGCHKFITDNSYQCDTHFRQIERLGGCSGTVVKNTTYPFLACHTVNQTSEAIGSCDQIDGWGCNGVVADSPNVCSGKGTCDHVSGTLQDGVCLCNSGYYGSNCEAHNCHGVIFNSTTVCSGKGTCQSPNSCQCNSGYYGNNCESHNCFGVHFNSTTVCSGKGKCPSPNTCQCNTGFSGASCNVTSSTGGAPLEGISLLSLLMMFFLF